MMREKTIERIIREFIAKELTIDPATITHDTDLVNDLNADSMDVVNIVTAIESRFKVTFPDESKIKYEGYTLQFLMDGVTRALQEKEPRVRARRVDKNVAPQAN